MARRGLQPIYEWCWERPDGGKKHTRSPRTAHTYYRFADRLGGTVTRSIVGYKLPSLLNELARQALDG